MSESEKVLKLSKLLKVKTENTLNLLKKASIISDENNILAALEPQNKARVCLIASYGLLSSFFALNRLDKYDEENIGNHPVMEELSRVQSYMEELDNLISNSNTHDNDRRTKIDKDSVNKIVSFNIGAKKLPNLPSINNKESTTQNKSKGTKRTHITNDNSMDSDTFIEKENKKVKISENSI